MKYLVLFLLFTSLNCFGQDIISTKKGDITISPINHGSLVLEQNDHIIYVDPYGGSALFEAHQKPTIVL